jgi:hypothetical protein
MKYGQMERIVRGMVVDVLEDGVAPLFSETDILDAANAVAPEYHGRRPEAFVSGRSLSLGSPGSMLSSKGCLAFKKGETSVNFFRMIEAVGGDGLQDGSLSIDFLCSDSLGEGGPIVYSGLETSRLVASVDESGLTVSIEDVSNAESAEILIEGSFLDGRWRTLFVSLDEGLLYVSVSGFGEELEHEEAYGGMLLPSVAEFVLGYSPPSAGGDPTVGDNFSGRLAMLSVMDEDGEALLSAALDDGSGYVAADSVSGNHGSVFGPTIEWLSEGDVPVSPWAERTFCHGVASMLLSQRGKDAHYRKAADLMERAYRAEG